MDDDGYIQNVGIDGRWEQGQLGEFELDSWRVHAVLINDTVTLCREVHVHTRYQYLPGKYTRVGMLSSPLSSPAGGENVRQTPRSAKCQCQFPADLDE